MDSFNDDSGDIFDDSDDDDDDFYDSDADSDDSVNDSDDSPNIISTPAVVNNISTSNLKNHAKKLSTNIRGEESDESFSSIFSFTIPIINKISTPIPPKRFKIQDSRFKINVFPAWSYYSYTNYVITVNMFDS